jgi:cystinosin
MLSIDFNFLDFTSHLLGWFYFFCWSISFYPQVILNHQRKSVQGLSFDFVVLNFIGFASYSIYNISFYSDEVQREYYSRFGSKNPIQLNDVAFSVHACVLSAVTLAQYTLYGNLVLSRLSKTIIYGAMIGLGILGLQVIRQDILYLDILYFISAIKMAVSLFKYIPQMYLNFSTKSTVGWSIENILLDFGGGIFSLFQSVIDSIIIGNATPIIGNPVKTALSFTSLIFDIVFILQHHWFYQIPHTVDEEVGLISNQ